MVEVNGSIQVSKSVFSLLKDCVSTDQTRYFLNYVYFDAEEGKLVATDGRRIAIVNVDEGSEIKTGFFTPVKIGKEFHLLRKEIEAVFPNYKKVIPNLTEYTRFTMDGESTFSIIGKSEKDSPFICDFIAKTGMRINLDYLKVLKEVATFQVYYIAEELNKAIYFDFDLLGCYIVMPMLREL